MTACISRDLGASLLERCSKEKELSAGCEAAVCPCGQEGQLYFGVCYKEHGQQVEELILPPLLCPGEATSEAQCPVLGSPVQDIF